jgi:hypothetical protein
MNKLIVFGILTILIVNSNNLHSQNHPNIQTIPTGQNLGDTVFLSSDTLDCNFANPHETTDYTVSNIPYTTQVNNGNIISNMGDDVYSPMLNIGFDFCFFGQSYSQFYVCSNGWLSFTPQVVDPSWISNGLFNTQLNADPFNPLPNTTYNNPKNCIFGAWQDWNPASTFGGSIKYQTQGTAPNRKLIVSWVEVPLQGQLYNSSNSNDNGNFHIILYESTNTIEVYIQSKPSYSWSTNFTSKATQGLYNPDGTYFIGSPSRNATVWSAYNDAYRWTPSGNEISPSLVWYEVGNPTPIAIDTSMISVVIDSVDKQYTCHLEYPNCFRDWAYQFCNLPDTVSVGLTNSSSTLENSEVNSFRVFPNPINDVATIIVNPEFLDSKLKIVDYSGKEVFSSSIQTLQMALNISHLNSGLYFLYIDQDRNQRLKLIKL